MVVLFQRLLKQIQDYTYLTLKVASNIGERFLLGGAGVMHPDLKVL